MAAALKPAEANDAHAGLAGALAACRIARSPSRELDTRIALAVFPAIQNLRLIEPGVWRQEDGSRVRALLYSETCRAAATLVPQGCWIETHACETLVLGDRGRWVGAHPCKAIALCIAALSARLAEASCAH